MTALVVMAKACVPGRVKTRLHPPFTLDEAAAIAAAALADTLDVVRRTAVDRRILAFDGDPSGVDCRGFDVIAQARGSLDERLAAVFDLMDEPTLLVGMDTPQMSAAQLRLPQTADICFGPAVDGGFWALGMRSPRGDVIRGVEMSRADTGAHQLAAFDRAGLTVELLDTLHDVDDARDAHRVAAQIPRSSFARAVEAAAGSTRVAG